MTMRREISPGQRLLRLGVASEVDLSPLREKAFTTTLTAPGQGCPSSFRAHPGAKSMLLFACSFRGLKCAFHMGKDGERLR